jgi:hypothetical protein
MIVRFNRILTKTPRSQVHVEFANFLRASKTELKAQLEATHEDLIEGIKQAKIDKENIMLQKKDVVHELEHISRHYHPGKFNEGSRMWSCCGNSRKRIVGCREIK